MIKLEDKKIFLTELYEAFPIKNNCEVSLNILEKYESETVYYFFYGHSWLELISDLDFRMDGDILEKACLYLDKNEFRYFFSLYIYASLLNSEGWAFEYSFFIHYLTPDFMGEDTFFDFIEQFDELQKKLIYEFVRYKSEDEHDLIAIDAFNSYWFLYS